MKFFSSSDSIDAVRSYVSSPDTERELRVDITGCLDRSVALARFLLHLLVTEQASFLHISEYGIWPSVENRDLFYGIRALSGCQALVRDVPGQSFEAGEAERLVTYMQIMFLNCWGGALVGLGNRHRISFSHDSWVSIRCSDDIDRQIEMVGEFGLPCRMDVAPDYLMGFE